MKAHGLIGAARSRHVMAMLAPTASAADRRNALDQIEEIIRQIPQAQKFDFGVLEADVCAGHAESACGLFADGAIRMPFEDCYFEHRWHEADGTEVLSAYLASHEVEGFGDYDLVATEFRHYPIAFWPRLASKGHGSHVWIWAGLIVAVNFVDSGTIEITPLADFYGYDRIGERGLNVQAVNTFGPVCVMSALLASKTADVRHVQAPRLLNEQRAKKGKAPLFSHRVVTITPSCVEALGEAAKDSLSGPRRASPRLHLRRGHRRVLPSGRVTWVRPCAVGDKRRGFVTHDYRFIADGTLA